MSTHTAKKNAQMILAIEDQPADAELIRIYLEETAFKHEFLTSDSLAGGLTLLRDREIDIVLLDLSLSDTTGFNTLRQYLKEAAHVPVVWATQVLETLMKAGAPSRAEVTDAAMGQRAECVMLNKGLYVRETIRFLAGILHRMDRHQYKKTARLSALTSWRGPQPLDGDAGQAAG